MSPYDAYFFITKNINENFGIISFQIDNTLNIRIKTFIKKEETEIMEIKFKIKTQTILETGISENFNNYHITIKVKSIIVVQKYQTEILVFVNIKDNVKK